MIQGAGAYIKTIVSFLLISVFVEIIAPEGYKKYLKLLMGLMLTITVLRPIIYVTGLSSEQLMGIIERRTYEIWDMPEAQSQSEGESLAEYIFKEKLEESICVDSGADKAEVLIDESNEDYGKVLQIKLYKSAKGDDDKKKAAYVAGRYGVSPKDIEFIYQ